MATAPNLKPPGAGLPRLERFIGNLILRRAVRRYQASATDDLLARETERVLDLARNCDESSAGTPVLIKRVRGIEDSSRHWSVYMTLDHLRIVTDAIARVIRSLAAHTRPTGNTRIEDVKPSPDSGPETLQALQRSVGEFREITSGIDHPRSEHTYPHPWFGPLDIAGWHILCAIHLKIHRRQVEAILRGLDT